ncbi:MAG: aminoacyl-tRNA hydrolase [Gemmatimonas sp.]|nr:aminoacyl-tRNA hydrolase [Gemmatimonas sp.]
MHVRRAEGREGPGADGCRGGGCGRRAGGAQQGQEGGGGRRGGREEGLVESTPVKLVVGLGNPGPEYETTRHNVGWWVIDHLADVWRFPPWRAMPDARATDGEVDGRRVRLLKPQTFMNLSGHALAPYVQRPFWAIANDLLVVVDDVALPLGTYRFRAKGSAGGHNGLRSVEDALGTQEYARLRIGIGRADAIPGEVLRDFVLGDFTGGEAAVVRELFPALRAGVTTWITDGIVAAMNRHSGRPASPEPPPPGSSPPPESPPPESLPPESEPESEPESPLGALPPPA